MKPHAPSSKNLLQRQWGLLFVMSAGLAVSFAAFWFAHNAEQRRILDEFRRRADVRHALIRENMRGYEECLLSLRNLFASSDDVTLAEFITCTRDIRERHPGIQALQWVPRIPHALRPEFEARARREIRPDYTLNDITAEGAFAPAAERPVYFPVLYTDPIEGNESSLGLDLQASQSKGDLLRSLETRGVVLSRKFTLVRQAPGAGRYGVVMKCPVYRSVSGTEELLGLVIVAFRPEDMLAQSWVTYPANAVDALILDMSEPDENERFLFERRARPSPETDRVWRTPADLPPDSLYVRELQLGGRTWRCHYSPSPGWIASEITATAPMVFMGGLAFTVVLCAFVISLRRRAEVVEHQVGERTAELRHTQGLLEADIQKRQSVEAELRESRRQLDSLLGQMPGMAYRYANQTPPVATLISLGAIDILGFTPAELASGVVRYENLVLPEDRARREEAIAAALAGQKPYESEYRLRDKQGRIKWVLDRGQGIYAGDGQLLFIEGLAIDITGRKQAAEEKAEFDRQLLESQKLESLGVLAGGIAHDFNNLLTTILGNASMAGVSLPEQSPLRGYLQQIEEGSRRAAELCQQMLAYSGKGRFLVQRVSLEQLVRETTPLLEHSISKRASLRFEFHPDVPAVEADATQIRQIIMNLVVNASDAIGDHDGVITVETAVVRRSDVPLSQAVLPPDGDHELFACLRVRDTGGGMSPATISRIFDPFFTTKFAGRGLGLAAVQGIVRGHRGGLLVSSQLGAGSSFTLLLPAVASSGAENPARVSAETRARSVTGTVLLIDDEVGVRAIAEQMFRAIGLETLVAADGVEGMALFKQHQGVISLVLLDLTMPRMNGEETLRALRELAPRLPVILTSGYNESAVPERSTDAHVSFLQKPFSLQALHTQIGKMLG